MEQDYPIQSEVLLYIYTFVKFAPRVGFEPTTNSLTASCATAALPGNALSNLNSCQEYSLEYGDFNRTDLRDPVLVVQKYESHFFRKECAMRNQTEVELMLKGYGLTTAEILYRMPDHRSILQSYIWQEYDQFPRLPRLCGFLGFWNKEIEGPLFKVRVAHAGLVSAREYQFRDGALVVH